MNFCCDSNFSENNHLEMQKWAKEKFLIKIIKFQTSFSSHFPYFLIFLEVCSKKVESVLRLNKKEQIS